MEAVLYVILAMMIFAVMRALWEGFQNLLKGDDWDKR